MDDSRARQIQQIFLAALELPAKQRDAWLRQECGTDDALIGEVLSLLDHAEPSLDPLEQDLDQVIADIPRLGGDDETQIQTVHEQPAGINPDDFLTKLSEVGVLSPDEFASVSDSVASGDPTMEPRQLASRLVSEGKLTEYQASALLKVEPELLIDKYLILDLIDVGGMGMVFKAIHRTMNRVVAVKMISRQMLGSVDLVKRFQREVRVAATLEHPNIVRAYDADETRGVNFLVMEYVRGDNLSRIVRTSGPLPLDKAVDCIRQAAVGLQHAHERGIVHRDIKPGNLLLSDQGVVKILDLGLAHIDESLSQNPAEDAENDSGRPYVSRTELTAAGTVLGTASFMAPEQSLDAHLVDFRSDIYSLGCTLYYLLTGDTPYTGSTVFKVFVEHREADVPSLRDKRPDVPDSLDAVFHRMVAKKPEERFQSIAEFLVALDDCRIALPVRDAKKTDLVATSAAGEARAGDSDTSRPPSAVEQTVPQKRMAASRLLWVVSVVAVVALVAINWADRDADVVELPLPNNGNAVASRSETPTPDPRLVDGAWDVSETGPGEAQVSAADLIASGRWEWQLDHKLPEPINSPDMEFGADMSADGLMMIVSSSRGLEKGNLDLFMATRASRKAPWSEMFRLPESVNTEGYEVIPQLSDNGMTLTFQRHTESGLKTLTTYRKSPDDTWSVPVELGEIPLGINHRLTRDGLTVFSLQRQDPSNEKSAHLLRVSRRSSTDEPFGEVTTSALDDSGLPMASATLSNDGRLLVYAQRGEISGSTWTNKLFVATRSDWDSTWSRPVSILPSVDRVHEVRLPFGDRTLLYSSDAPNAGPPRHEIYMAKLVEVEESQPLAQSVPKAPADLLATGEWEWRVEKNLGPTINSPAIVFGADMTADRRTIVFSSLREQQPPGNRDLWIATRSSPEAPWSEPVRLPREINTDAKEEQPVISSDGLSLWFRRDVHALMYSVRESVDAPWSEAIPDPHLKGQLKNYEMTPNGLTAYRPVKLKSQLGSNDADNKLIIWRRDSRDSSFQNSSESRLPSVSRINATGSLSDDGRMYVFAQEIDNGKDARQTRLFFSTRADNGDSWSEPSLLFPEISDDTVSSGSPRLLDDNRTLLFTSNLPGGEGSFDIWMARLVKR
ncbi:MAG: serine/threonine-protein kinase [Planctomycetota bacterium]|nr:serine/threonine-protein kinase [Planctomycetota bacterium]MDA1158857.1 serine/threonine-protein kinase [Planctomycetota bacterium]